MSDWEVDVKREIHEVSFVVQEENGERKVAAKVIAANTGEILGEFECDAQDITGIKNLLKKHKVLPDG